MGCGWLWVRLREGWMTLCYGEEGTDGGIIRSFTLLGRDEGGGARRGETCIHTRLAAAAVFVLFFFEFYFLFLSSIHGLSLSG